VVPYGRALLSERGERACRPLNAALTALSPPS